ncbi:MAG TPA: DUF1573 domain-containing protein [Gemmataceae bacterium]|nr:DUF1573 domain-containing protein [Gemmataceae bacterium]
MLRPWLLAAAALVASLTWCAAGQAALEGDPPAFDAGEVHAGAPLSHRFILVNRGSQTVEILETQPSCGCATTTLDRRLLRPGDSGSLLLTVNTLTRPDGPASWGASVRCRCGDRDEETTLTLTARVQADLSLTPSALVVETDGPVHRSIVLTDRRPAAMTVKAETTCPNLQVRLDAPIHAGDGPWTYTVHLEAPAELPEGRYEEVLHLYTSDPEYADLKMPFTIVKRGRQRVSVSPAAVELTGDSPSRLVLLRGGDGDMVEIGGADADAAAATCEWAPGARPTAAVRLRLDPSRLPADGLKTMVHVHLVQPAVQTVDVPVTCRPR